MYRLKNKRSTKIAEPFKIARSPGRSWRRGWALIVVLIFDTLTPSHATALTFLAYAPGTSHHAIGIRKGVSAWSAVSSMGVGFLTYGPDTSKLRKGAFEAHYSLSVDNNSRDDQVIGYVDVYDDVGGKEIARREIHRREFARPYTYQDFRLSFVEIGSRKLQFRVFVLAKASIAHAFTRVVRVSNLDRPRMGAEHDRGPFKHAVEVLPLTAGNYIAQFKLRADKNDGDKKITLDVHNRTTNTVLATIDVAHREILPSRTSQTFELPFEFDGVGKLELRVHAKEYLEKVSTSIYPALALSYQGASIKLRHELGFAANGSWLATSKQGPGYLTYGPFARSVPPGVATATFNLLIDENSQNNDVVALLDAYDASSGKVVAQRRVRRTDFNAPKSSQSFNLEFEIAKPSALEFRVFTYGIANLEHVSTTITPDRLTLSALWSDRAHWEYRKRDVYSSHGVQDYATSSLISLDGTWYAFNRVSTTEVTDAQSNTCAAEGAPPLQVVVRSSMDQGVSWSDPVVIASPSSKPSAPDHCEIVDGAAFYDADADVWHYLAQCVNPPANWGLCHYTRTGSSPMGVFTPDAANPVVVGGQLWSQICAGSNKTCPSTMKDEGTPQILGKADDGYFYVTFHGANYAPTIVGARGAARTLDFVNWQVTGGNLPGDAMLSAKDCERWNAGWAPGGCIGEGDAKILRSNGMYYILTEAADQSLRCAPGQKWVFGLLRNPVLGPSGSWQNDSHNPIITNQNTSPAGCSLVYMNILRDGGELYLEFSLYSPDYPYPSYTYQLVDGPPDTSVMRVK